MDAPWFSQSTAATAAGGTYTALLIAASASDLRSRRIPNPLCAALAGGGVLYCAALSQIPWHGLAASLSGLGLGLAIWIPFYALRWMGAGDVKLFAAAAAWLGPGRALEGAFVAAMLGGVLAAGWMVSAYGAKGAAATASLAVTSPTTVPGALVQNRSRGAVPYGVALAAGALVAAWFPAVLLRVVDAAL